MKKALLEFDKFLQSILDGYLFRNSDNTPMEEKVRMGMFSLMVADYNKRATQKENEIFNQNGNIDNDEIISKLTIMKNEKLDQFIVDNFGKVSYS